MQTVSRILSLVVLLATTGAASAQTCEEAWTAYNEFKRRNVMEPAQYPLTVHGAAVRRACGNDALPVPPGTDTPHRPVVRKPQPQVKPAPPEKPKTPLVGAPQNR